MNKWGKIGILILILVFLGVGAIIFPKKKVVEERVKISGMRITSGAFENNQFIPVKYTCDGGDLSPPLVIGEVPPEAKSLVLIVDDPDAPAGTFVHWTVWNIDSKTTEIAEGTVPQGATQGLTDFGRVGWGGPCPPSGVHRYAFRLYAIETKISLPSSAKREDLDRAIERHILAQTALVGLYGR